MICVHEMSRPFQILFIHSFGKFVRAEPLDNLRRICYLIQYWFPVDIHFNLIDLLLITFSAVRDSIFLNKIKHKQFKIESKFWLKLDVNYLSPPPHVLHHITCNLQGLKNFVDYFYFLRRVINLFICKQAPAIVFKVLHLRSFSISF